MDTKRLAQTARLAPNAAQRQRLAQALGCKRWVWNWALARKQAHFQATGTTLATATLSKELPLLKRHPDTLWLAAVNAQMLQQVLRDLDRAYANFFAKRARCPRFKRRHQANQSFRLPQGTKLREGAVYCPSLGWLPLRLSRPIQGTIKSATYRRDACGDWFVSLTILTDEALPAPCAPQTSIGIDVGLTTYATLSDGTVIANPRFRQRGQRRLRRAQRTLARRVKGSANRRRAKQRVARLHRRIARQRTDFQHKLTSQLIQRYDLIAIEDLSLKGLARTKLARSFSDAAFGELFRQLRYKALWAGKHVVAVDRFFPSSKTCSACQVVNRALTLKDRQWTCSACGTKHVRDWNASQNILQEGWRTFAVGHTEKSNACGEYVSLAPASDA